MVLKQTAPSKLDCVIGDRCRIHSVDMVMSEAPARVVLSGASGMLGAALRCALEARGRPVLQLVRSAPASPGQLTWNPAAKPAIGDSRVLEGCAAAIHLSGASVAGQRWSAAYQREITASRVDSTQALATALAGLRRPPQTLLAASAVGIYGNRGDELLDDCSAPGTGFLASVCRQWEAAAQPAADAGIRIVHLRFGVVIGPGPGALVKMLPLFRLGLGGRLGSGRQWMSWISLTDAIAAILFALETPALAGPVNLTSPHPVTNAAFTQALAEQLQRPAFLPAPAFALRLVLGPMADETLLASARVFPVRLLAAGFRFAHPTVTEALAAALD
jgi:uncharacterized protein (TIGR01777 family)